MELFLEHQVMATEYRTRSEPALYRCCGALRFAGNQRFRCLGCYVTSVVASPRQSRVSFCGYAFHVFLLSLQGPSIFLLQSATLCFPFFFFPFWCSGSIMSALTSYPVPCSSIEFLPFFDLWGRWHMPWETPPPFYFLPLFFHTFIVGIDLWVWRKGRRNNS